MPQHHFLSVRWRLTATLTATILLVGMLTPAHANRLADRNRQKDAAESERSTLQKKIHALKRDIGRTESAKSQAEETLSQSESAISTINRSLFDLSQEQAQAQAKLDRLTKQHTDLSNTIDTQQKQLAALVRNQYIGGSEDRMKLLLSGDDPSRISRELQYLGYVSQAQAALLTSLRANLAAIEVNRDEVQSTKASLDDIEQETREQKSALEKEKTQHTKLLSELSSKLTAQRKQAGTLEHDEQRLGGLVDKLSKLIEDQRRKDALAREKRRREQLERERKQSASNHAQGKVKRPQTADKNTSSKSVERNELTPEADVQDEAFARAFAALRGKLHLPVKGELLAKFGNRRGDGPSWKGLYILAPEGAEVRAVAGGRVVFADWLRGFGNLLIIDHGNQYLTIYGNNQAVLKHVGDVVNTGDVVATVGNSGGNEQSGLYFEMRHQGRAFDPLQWVTLR